MSLSAKLFIFIFSFWILATVVCFVTEDADLQAKHLQSEVENVISSPNASESLTWFENIGKVLKWDYSIFYNNDIGHTESSWNWIRYIFLYPLSGAVIISIMFLLLPALLQVAGGIIKIVSAFFGIR